jgi:hypothetical protein
MELADKTAIKTPLVSIPPQKTYHRRDCNNLDNDSRSKLSGIQFDVRSSYNLATKNLNNIESASSEGHFRCDTNEYPRLAATSLRSHCVSYLLRATALDAP